MNPLALLMLAQGSTHGMGQPFYGSQTSDLKGLTDALAAYKQFAPTEVNEADKGDSQKQSPIDRIKAAFQSLKDMHQPDASVANNAPADSPYYGPLGANPNAQFYGPLGAPAPQAPSQAPAPAPSAGVPMPQPRPADAPQAPSPMMSLFQRSAALQQDPLTGDYIDPTAAAKANAQPGIFSKLFA